MNQEFTKHIQTELANIQVAGTFKKERQIRTPQGKTISADDGNK